MPDSETLAPCLAHAITWYIGRARRGIGGALKPAIRHSGAESLPEVEARGLCPWQGVLRAGSHAADACEPRQVRKEAAVSSDVPGAVGVPSLSLLQASRPGWRSKEGARPNPHAERCGIGRDALGLLTSSEYRSHLNMTVERTGAYPLSRRGRGLEPAPYSIRG